MPSPCARSNSSDYSCADRKVIALITISSVASVALILIGGLGWKLGEMRTGSLKNFWNQSRILPKVFTGIGGFGVILGVSSCGAFAVWIINKKCATPPPPLSPAFAPLDPDRATNVTEMLDQINADPARQPGSDDYGYQGVLEGSLYIPDSSDLTTMDEHRQYFSLQEGEDFGALREAPFHRNQLFQAPLHTGARRIAAGDLFVSYPGFMTPGFNEWLRTHKNSSDLANKGGWSSFISMHIVCAGLISTAARCVRCADPGFTMESDVRHCAFPLPRDAVRAYVGTNFIHPDFEMPKSIRDASVLSHRVPPMVEALRLGDLRIIGIEGSIEEGDPSEVIRQKLVYQLTEDHSLPDKKSVIRANILELPAAKQALHAHLMGPSADSPLQGKFLQHKGELISLEMLATYYKLQTEMTIGLYDEFFAGDDRGYVMPIFPPRIFADWFGNTDDRADLQNLFQAFAYQQLLQEKTDAFASKLRVLAFNNFAASNGGVDMVAVYRKVFETRIGNDKMVVCAKTEIYRETRPGEPPEDLVVVKARETFGEGEAAFIMEPTSVPPQYYRGHPLFPRAVLIEGPNGDGGGNNFLTEGSVELSNDTWVVKGESRDPMSSIPSTFPLAFQPGRPVDEIHAFPFPVNAWI